MAVFGFSGPTDQPAAVLARMARPFAGEPTSLTWPESPADGGTGAVLLASTSDAWDNALVETPDHLLAFCGHLANARELASAAGLPSTASLAGLLHQLLEQSGDQLLEKMEGLFCVALASKGTGALTLLGDPTGGCFGWYYLSHGGGFYFSPRLPSLTALAGVPRELSPAALDELFATGYVLPPRTLLEGFRKTWPGQRVQWDGQTARAHQVPPRDIKPYTGQDPLPELRRLLEEQTAPLAGATDTAWLLSGGIDSSVLVACGSRQSSAPLPTFSATFPGSVLNEEDAARLVARHTGSQATYLDLGSRSELEDLPRITWELDEPFLDFSAIPSFALFERLAPHARGLVSGDGPDHLFGRHYPLVAKCRLHALAPLFKALHRIKPAPYLGNLAYITGTNLQGAYGTLFTYTSWHGGLDSYKQILAGPTDTVFPRTLEGIPLDLSPSGSFDQILGKMIQLDLLIDGAFGVFNKVGKMARAHDLKVNWPYLSPGVLDFCLSLPARSLVQGDFRSHFLSRSTAKYLLGQELGAELLPPRILEKSKGGFTPPLTTWLQEGLPRSAEDLLSPGLRQAGLFNRDFITRICREHRQGSRTWTAVLFLLISFDLWYNMFILGRQDTAPEFSLGEFGSIKSVD